MCGIAGFVDRSLGGERGRQTLCRMAEAIVHRGPDEGGAWLEDATGVGLAHRRLSILDLTEAGRQPMSSTSGRYVIVFNGEIYNHRDLRAELLESDASLHFRGHSDTEEMLAAFEMWGVNGAIERMNGMFAFALYDTTLRRLYLARDRLGEKPLYYGRVGRAIIFGSELKALRQHPAWRSDLDLIAVEDYFRYGYVTGRRSIFAGIGKVLPGELISIAIDDDGLPIKTRQYWSTAEVVRNGLSSMVDWSDAAAIEHLERLLEDAVAIRMEADVPLGAFLSGGVDSTTVVALMQRRASAPVKTFSIGFGERRFNEAESARTVAKFLGTDHTELYVTPQQALEVIPKLGHMYDEPFADASQIPTYLVSHLARQHVTVALSGDGGDELFGGYDRYGIGERFWRTSRAVPGPVRRLVANATEAIPIPAWNVLAGWLPSRLTVGRPGDRIHKLAGRLRLESFDAVYDSLLSLGASGNLLLERPVRDADDGYPPGTARSITSLAERMMAWDLAGYLPDDILTKVDRATMAVSLEGRIPLLDHRVVEMAWQLPMRLKRRGREGKWLLKQVLYRLVPRALVDRPKQGFGVPIEYWLRHELRDWAAELLSPASLESHGLLDANAVAQLRDEHLSGRRSWSAQLWTVLMFQSWLAGQSE